MNYSEKHQYYWCPTHDPDLAVYDNLESKEKVREITTLNREANRRMKAAKKRWRGVSPSSFRDYQ